MPFQPLEMVSKLLKNKKYKETLCSFISSGYGKRGKPPKPLVSGTISAAPSGVARSRRPARKGAAASYGRGVRDHTPQCPAHRAIHAATRLSCIARAPA
jgi:hypothetical protein